MKRVFRCIKAFFKKIFKGEKKVEQKIEKKEFDINELTEEQQARVRLLDDYYNTYLDVIESQITSMKCDYYMHFIDDETYSKRQDELARKLREVRENYIKELEAIQFSLA